MLWELIGPVFRFKHCQRPWFSQDPWPVRFYVYGYYAVCMCVCHMHVELMEYRWGSWIPWNWSYIWEPSCQVLEMESWSPGRVASDLNWSYLSDFLPDPRDGSGVGFICSLWSAPHPSFTPRGLGTEEVKFQPHSQGIDEFCLINLNLHTSVFLTHGYTAMENIGVGGY